MDGTRVDKPEDQSEAGGSTAKRLPAGVADAAFASLATFAAGLSAVTLCDDVDRGVYAIFFTAFGLGVVLSWNLVLIPSEVNAVRFPVAERMRRGRDTLAIGLPVAILGSLTIPIAAVIAQSITDSTAILGLAGTAAAATVLSPLQDHMRRLLHIAGASWHAAAVSVVQFCVVAISLGAMLAADAPVAVMPFGALAIANAISLTTGIVLGGVLRQEPLEEPLRFGSLARQGRWLLLQASVPSAAHFIVAAVIAELAGVAVLGYTEAARVVAQPVLVLATGLTAVLSPPAMEAAMARDVKAANRTRNTFRLAMVGGGALYLAIAAVPWVLNPMQLLVPSAYVVSGLVGATIVANLISTALYVEVNELLGAKRARTMAVIAIVTSPVLVLVALTGRATEAFARPLGKGLRDAIQVGWYQAALHRHYHHGTE